MERVVVPKLGCGRVALDGDAAGTGRGADSGATTVDRAGDVVSVEGALHHDGLIDVDGAGTSVGVEGEAGVVGEFETDAASAGGKMPVGRGIAGDLDGA